LNEVLDEVISISRYSHIPLCNLKHDRLNHVTDVLYARILKSANCISWFSLNGHPEIGGGKSKNLFHD
jgi:DNA polymerase epsilon subunit 1